MSMYKKINLQEACWISAAGSCRAPMFRRVFSLPEVSSATVTIAGLGIYEMYINGKKVGEDLFLPLNTDFHKRDDMDYCGYVFDEELGHRLYCPVYDITSYLREGENAICFMMGPGWYEAPIYGWGGPGFGNIKLCYLVKYTDREGKEYAIGSDAFHTWNTSYVKEANLACGELHDYRDYNDEWMKADFDDSAWNKVHLENAPETILYQQDSPSDKIIRYIMPKLLWKKEDYCLYDVGENITGYPILISRAQAGEKISVKYGEELTADGNLDEEHVYEQYTDFIVDGTARQLHSKFTWLGFRYFQVQGAADVDRCAVIHSDVSVTASFLCDNALLNWIQDAYVRTQLDNMHCGIPSDCPHIERRGYTGDGQLTCHAAMLQLDAERFYRKWIYDIADCQDRQTGHVQYTAPFYPSGGGPGGYGCAIVMVPYILYKHYGDKEVLRDLFPQMLQWFESLEAHSQDDLVCSDRPGAWCLGEWSVPNGGKNVLEDVIIPAPYVNTYFYIKSMEQVLEIGKILGLDEQCSYLAERITRKKQALVQNYYDADTGDFAGNVQGSNAYALDLGLGDTRTLENMVRYYEQFQRFDTGIFGTDLLTRVLFENHQEKLAIDLLTSQGEQTFYQQMKAGATTIWEHWFGHRSRCHPMFGAVSTYLFEYILGIRQSQESVAFKDVIIEPRCREIIKKASGYITTPLGKISVTYDEQKIDVCIPEGMKAVLRLGEKEYPLSPGKQVSV